MNATGWKLVITITLRRHECGMINVFFLLVSVVQYQKVSMNELHITAVNIAPQRYEWSKPPEDTFNHVLLKNPHT